MRRILPLVAPCHVPPLVMHRALPRAAPRHAPHFATHRPRHVTPSPRIAPVTLRRAFVTRCAFATHCPCRVASCLRHALHLRHALPRRNARFKPVVEMEESVSERVGRVECKQVQASAGSLVVNYLDSRLLI